MVRKESYKMGIYTKVSIGLSEIEITDKLKGLLMLEKAGFAVPEWIYLDNEEFWNYIKSGKLSEEVIMGIEKFIDKQNKAKSILYAIRAESKRGTKKQKRPPLSLLNVGIMCNEESKNENYELYETYIKRAQLINMDIKYGRSFKEEILENLKRFYIDMNSRMENEAGYNYGVIIQKMVFGNRNSFSGNGIVCRSMNKDAAINGVFLQEQVGIGVENGSWGKNEISFNALKKLNSNAYYKIENDYLKIEKIFGNNIYLEFTIEEDSIYYLDFIYRRKNIYVGEE